MENTEQKTCRVQMYYGKPCGRPLYDGEKCICHSEKEDKEVKLFQQELDKIFADEKAEYYNLTGFIFPKKGYELPREYKKDTFFTGATFLEEARFLGTTFQEHVDYTEATFLGKALFLQAKFCGKATFIGANFTKGAYFTLSKFQRRAYFADSRFPEGAFFGHVRFKDGIISNNSSWNSANFNGAEFGGFTQFLEDEFSGPTRFSGATFVVDTRFLWSVFKENVSFSGCTVTEGARVLFAVGHKHQKMFFEKSFFESCVLTGRNALVFHRVSLENCCFIGTDVTCIDFVDVSWSKKKLFWGLRCRSVVSDESGTKPDNFLISQLYRRLQANYINNYRYAEAGDFHIGEQEMMRKAKGSGWMIWRRVFCTNFLYKYISYYGESFLLPLFWMLAVLFLFPLYLIYDGIIKSGYWDAFWKNLSFVTFNRTDISKYVTESYQQGIVTIEGLLLVVLVTFFVLALRRQYKRKTF